MEMAFTLMVGGLIGWGIAHFYAYRSARELQEVVGRLLNTLNLLASGLENAPNIRFNRDDDGNIIGLTVFISAKAGALELQEHPATVSRGEESG